MLPDRLLPHTVTVQTAATKTDRYENTVLDWANVTETTIKGRFEQILSDAVALRENTNGRDDAVSVWRFYTNAAITMTQRLVWDGKTFDVDGEVAPVYGAAALDHYEALVRVR